MAAFDQMCILGNKSLSRSNLPSGSLPAEKASPEIASGANKICWQKLHSRPGIALFLHNRPTDAIFGSTLAQLLERKVLFARPRYGFFGGQFIPLATKLLILPIASRSPLFYVIHIVHRFIYSLFINVEREHVYEISYPHHPASSPVMHHARCLCRRYHISANKSGSNSNANYASYHAGYHTIDTGTNRYANPETNCNAKANAKTDRDPRTQANADIAAHAIATPDTDTATASQANTNARAALCWRER